MGFGAFNIEAIPVWFRLPQYCQTKIPLQGAEEARWDCLTSCKGQKCKWGRVRTVPKGIDVFSMCSASKTVPTLQFQLQYHLIIFNINRVPLQDMWTCCGHVCTCAAFQPGMIRVGDMATFFFKFRLNPHCYSRYIPGMFGMFGCFF